MSLNIISNYTTTLFLNNNNNSIAHYKKMKLISTGFKGIYLYECKNISNEEYIINLFRDKITELLIAQNVLMTSKETSSEEIQSFFHRTILCNYSTLFYVEINDSFTDFQ